MACPALALHARDDARMPFEEGRLVASAIAEARFVPIQGRNHVLIESEPAFAPSMARMREFMDQHADGPAQGRVSFSLTAKEPDLLEPLAQGLDNLQIAAHMALAEKTVRNKVSAVFDKLEVETRPQAIVKAREAGYGRKPLPR